MKNKIFILLILILNISFGSESSAENQSKNVQKEFLPEETLKNLIIQ